MGMSTSVSGFISPDKKWNDYKTVWDNCDTAGIAVPNEVIDYFDGVHPGTTPGMETVLPVGVVTEKQDDVRMIYEIDVAKIPSKITCIRVTNSW